ncbi:MAG: hypothetical protein VB035_13835 [Candidatus Fimivivens sp.]|nr:hypothetical protein [Candidatus Fimivivens sp.]
MINNQKHIYIIISKTNTVLGRLIRHCLGVKYNHCSIALDDSLEQFYSFGRKELYNMFRAGFVTESKNSGFFKEHNNADISVLKVPVTEVQWQRISEEIAIFKSSKCKYSVLGLLLCYLGIPKKRKHKYFCSQFVAEVLEKANTKLVDKPSPLVKPHDFLGIVHGQLIYKGAIGRYEAA